MLWEVTGNSYSAFRQTAVNRHTHTHTHSSGCNILSWHNEEMKAHFREVSQIQTCQLKKTG